MDTRIQTSKLSINFTYLRILLQIEYSKSLLNLGLLTHIDMSYLASMVYSSKKVNIAPMKDGTVKHVRNDHLYNKIYYLWLIQ